MRAGEAVEKFAKLNPNEEVWITWISKEGIKENFKQQELTDDNDELIATDSFVTDEVAQEVFNALDNDDYLWERFNETFDDVCRNALEGEIDKQKKEQEFEDLEKEQELWEA
jgi:membrane-associated HD superfamily phosphohydrolase